MAAIGLGLRAQKGGAVAVVVRVAEDVPDVLVSTFLATHDPDDQLALEPYGVAYATVRGGGTRDEAEVLVEQGRRRQGDCAERGLRTLLAGVTEPIVAGLLINRAGWITDLLEHSLGWAEHVPVCEGLAVREAFRVGLRRCAVVAVEYDEKTLTDTASETLRLTVAEIEARLKTLGTGAGKPWRKEQKLACLAAWIAIADVAP